MATARKPVEQAWTAGMGINAKALFRKHTEMGNYIMKASTGTNFVQAIFLCMLVGLTTEVNAATPWLHTEGNKIKDPTGNVVVLRGISLIDLGHLEGWQGGAINMINRLTDKTDAQGSSPGWYPRIIRIPICPADETGGWPYRWYPGSDSFYNNLLRPVVDYCASKDIYVIIDWHYIRNTWERVDETSEFWEYMAPRFANDSHVMFELFNEPINDVGTDTQDWLNVKTNMQTWFDIVRTYAPNNLILVGGPQWCQILEPQVTDPVVGDNIVYVAHLYPAHWYGGPWQININGIVNCAAVYPVMMTEWGFSMSMGSDTLLNGTITEYGQPLVDFLELHGIGNTAWVASYNWGPPMFCDPGDPLPPGTWDLRIGEGEMGGFVKDTLYARRNDDQPSWLYGDFTNDNRVDMNDVPRFCENWLVTDCNNTELDLNDDCLINFYEYSFFTQNWLVEVP